MQLVWLIPPKQQFEYDWIHELFADCPISEEIDATTQPLPDPLDKAVIIFNHSIDYEAFFEKQTHPYIAVHFSDETLGDSVRFYDSPLCRFVIRTYFHPHHSIKPNVMTIGLGYRTGLQKHLVKKERHFHWNFAGNIHDAHRASAVQLFQSLIPYQVHTTQEGFNSSQNLPLAHYTDWLCSSKFTLCPVGQGNIDSFRVYEACEAGSIPIVLANTSIQNYSPASYWQFIFPMWKTEIPFVMANSMQECLQKTIFLLMNPSLLEIYQRNLHTFWSKVKYRWKKTIQTTIAKHWPLDESDMKSSEKVPQIANDPL